MTNLDRLRQIVERHQSDRLVYKTADSRRVMSVDVQTANALLTVHEALSDSAKGKFAEQLESLPKTIWLIDFAWKRVR